ncbi:hypothetical protein ABZP36_002952 [Zizania latifolia]
MEEPPEDNGQLSHGADPELEPMMLEDDGEGKSHTMDDANGHSSMDVDRGCHSMDTEGSSLCDDGKGKCKSYAQVPIDMSIPSTEKFCKEASRSFFDEIGLISHQINIIMSLSLMGFQELFDSLGEVIVEPSYDPSNRGPGSRKVTAKCQFDLGGYFLIKGMEKVFIAQEQRCLTRIWVDDRPCLTVSFFVKLIDSSKNEDFTGSKIISISFLNANMPIWLMFFALGISSDKAVFDMIDMQDCDACNKESDELCEGSRKTDKAHQYVDKLIKNSKFPPAEPFDDCIDKYMFPSITGKRNKALFLGYMVKCLLMAFTGKRKCDNKNKRLELAGQLLGRELQAHIRHAERLMVKALQRDLNSDRELQDLDRYLDASIITNGLNRAFSTGSWCHPYKRNERCSGIVATLRRTNPLQMMSDLRKTRQQVAYAGKAKDKHQREVRVFSDAGRILRPLLVVENLDKIGKLKGSSYSFQALEQQEIIEFIGIEEEQDIQSAWEIRHLLGSGEEAPLVILTVSSELHPSFLLGLSCGLIPLVNHNFARRVLFQSEKHSQQAIGYSATNPRIRVDTLSHQLYYPQRPLFKTVIADCIGRSEYTFGRKDDFARPQYFNGQNTIVQRILLSSNDEGKNFALVTLRQSCFFYRRTHFCLNAPQIDVLLHSRFGFSRWGAESVLNGRTGERMNSLIFMGPTFYQRLIHMAEDKVKFRNTGPVHPLTRQPVADRKRSGGVKFGEMEPPFEPDSLTGTSMQTRRGRPRHRGQAEATQFPAGVFVDGMTWLKNSGAAPNAMHGLHQMMIHRS